MHDVSLSSRLQTAADRIRDYNAINCHRAIEMCVIILVFIEIYFTRFLAIIKAVANESPIDGVTSKIPSN